MITIHLYKNDIDRSHKINKSLGYFTTQYKYKYTTINERNWGRLVIVQSLICVDILIVEIISHCTNSNVFL